MTLEICRICGSRENLKDVFRDGDDELLDQIRVCANIQIDAFDILPKFVCIVCEQGLAFSYRLRKRGEETEKKLRLELQIASKVDSCSKEKESQKADMDEALIEELGEDQLWVKEEESVHFNDHEELIISDEYTDVDVLPSIPEGSYDETEEWITLQNESYSEDGEILDDPGNEKVEVDLMDLICVSNEMANELEHTETQIEYQFPKQKAYLLQNCSRQNTDKTSNHNIIQLKKDTVGLKRLHCELCSKTFKTVSHLNVHKKSHSKEKTYACEICGKKLRYQGNLRVHMRTIHKNITDLEILAQKTNHNESQYIDSLPEECKALTSIFLHDKCKLFKCTVCGKISDFKNSHIAHCRIHLNYKPFQCKFCVKSFRQLATLKEHEVIHSGRRPYKCNVCSSSFVQKSALTKHEFGHTGRKPFECGICGTAFGSRTALRVHERIHTGEKPYSCDICAETFREKRQLLKHNQVWHHSEEDRKEDKNLNTAVWYYCTWKNCNKRFLLRLNLITHLQRHYSPTGGGNTVKCGDCHKEFFKPIYMWRHQKLFKGTCALGLKPKELPGYIRRRIKYSICQTCGKVFVRPAALARHRLVHLCLREHKCTKCQMKFRHRYSLSLHMKKHAVSQIEIVPLYVVEPEDVLVVQPKDENNLENLCCFHCFEMFSNAELLENHLFCYHDS